MRKRICSFMMSLVFAVYTMMFTLSEIPLKTVDAADTLVTTTSANGVVYNIYGDSINGYRAEVAGIRLDVVGWEYNSHTKATHCLVDEYNTELSIRSSIPYNDELIPVDRIVEEALNRLYLYRDNSRIDSNRSFYVSYKDKERLLSNIYWSYK